MNQNYKLTVTRSTGESATYRLEHIHSTGDDEEQELMLADLAAQAVSGEAGVGRGLVQVEIIVVNEDGSEREAI